MENIYAMLGVLARYLSVEVYHPTTSGPNTVVIFTRRGGEQMVIEYTCFEGEETLEARVSGIGYVPVPKTADEVVSYI